MEQAQQFGVSPEILAAICARYDVLELSLFGSAARGELRPDSDIDLLVVFEPGARIGLIRLAKLRRELGEAFKREVDLVPRDGLKPALRSGVLAEARPLYAA